jgi:hypothetical protein
VEGVDLYLVSFAINYPEEIVEDCKRENHMHRPNSRQNEPFSTGERA